MREVNSRKGGGGREDFKGRKIVTKGLEPCHICISVPNSLLPAPSTYYSVLDMLPIGLN